MLIPPCSIVSSMYGKSGRPLMGAFVVLHFLELIGRGGRDRKLHPLSQVLNHQRRSTAALLPIGVKWCQISGNCCGR